MVAMIVVKIPFFKVKACAESLFLETPRRPPFMLFGEFAAVRAAVPFMQYNDRHCSGEPTPKNN
uniref:Uncharacterized protein n=1 Tax=Magallana gigas TaxID=29159 RepID=K1Q4V1_MAGGI